MRNVWRVSRKQSSVTETYTLYIDESGDEGIDRDNQFQSPLFFLGAVLVQDKEIEFVKDSIFNLEISLGKKLHFSSMTHEQKVYACKKIATLPITLFGHISDKNGLYIGGYRSTIEGQKGKFYNKNVHYLLEIVTSYCEENSIVLSKVFFDKIETKNYSQLKNYLHTIARTDPKTESTKIESGSALSALGRINSKSQSLIRTEAQSKSKIKGDFMKFITSLFLLLPLFANAKDLKVGDAAPLFKAQTQEGKDFSLESRKGQWTVLYFYPKADTPGCTKQACAFRDSIKKIRELNAEVYGVSADEPKDLANFHKKHNLNFTLLADPRNNIIENYGTKMPMLKISKRWTFIISPELKIAAVDQDVDPVKDADKVAEKIKSFQKAQ